MSPQIFFSFSPYSHILCRSLLAQCHHKSSSPSPPIHTYYVEACWHNVTTNLLLLLPLFTHTMSKPAGTMSPQIFFSFSPYSHILCRSLLVQCHHKSSSPSPPIHTYYVEACWHNVTTNLLLLLPLFTHTMSKPAGTMSPQIFFSSPYSHILIC